MLLILTVSVATLMTILFSLMKNAGKRDEIAELMADEDEEPDEERPEGKVAGGGEDERQPWERDADWWRSS